MRCVFLLFVIVESRVSRLFDLTGIPHKGHMSWVDNFYVHATVIVGRECLWFTRVRVRMLSVSRGRRLIVVSNWKMSDKMRRLECEHSNCESCLQWRCAKYFEYEIDEMKKLGVRPGFKIQNKNSKSWSDDSDRLSQTIVLLLRSI